MTDTVSLEQKIADHIGRSSLAIKVKEPINGPQQGVYIDNPVKEIKPGRSPRFGKHPKKLPEQAPGPDLLWPELPALQSASLGLGDTPPPYADRVNLYLDWGAARAVKPEFIGVCESFNCVVLAILTAANSPLSAGTIVEYIGVRYPKLGHAIAAINRSNPTEAYGETVPNPTKWGADCIVVDQWYALQADCPPVFHVAGNHVDAEYVTWLTTDMTGITMRGRFTARQSGRPPVSFKK
jgi:hypothetical protein